ncbi:MAG: hypothetical protein IJN65_02560 [Clostridia bacterium]|nr:hypothetical protein [Clostridia bacterium]
MLKRLNKDERDKVMKILMIGMAKVKYMPYLNFYLENIPKENNEIHLVYWNRDLKDEDLSAYTNITFHEFRCYQEDEVSPSSKIFSFIKYKKFVSRVLKSEKFDFVIALHSFPGVLNANILTKKFKDKYIFDYRDLTYENYGFYKKIINKLAANSKATFISSGGFKKNFFKENHSKLINSHNLLSDSLNHRRPPHTRADDEKIRIAYWGLARHTALNKKIIDKIAADNRFELHYYGREQKCALDLKEYTKQIGADNVFFHGEYKPVDRYEFSKNADIIHNVFYSTNTMLSMANKYYDGLVFCLPQIATEGAFMAKCIEDAKVGISCNPNNDDFLDKIYDYYKSIDLNEFNENCQKELDRIIAEYNYGSQFIKDTFSN